MTILFQNRQWAVTDRGLECLSFRYSEHVEPRFIPAEDLLREEGLYYWPTEMSGNIFVDIDAFIEAFFQALRFHGLLGEVDFDNLWMSFDVAAGMRF